MKAIRAESKVMDPVVRGTILEAIRLGAFQSAAARYAGISPQVLKRWIAYGTEGSGQADPSGEFTKFVAEFEKVKAVAIVRNLRLLDTIKETKGKAAFRAITWHLSKQSPEHFGDRIEVRGEITHRKTYSFLEPPIPVEGKVIDAEGNSSPPDVRLLAEETGDVEGPGSEGSTGKDGQGALFGEAAQGEGAGQEEVSDG